MAVSDTSRSGIGYNEDSIGKIFVGGAQYMTILDGKPVSLLFFQEITTGILFPFSFILFLKHIPELFSRQCWLCWRGQTGSLVFPSQVGYELTTCSSEGICQIDSEKELAGPCLLVGVPLKIFRINLILFSSTNRWLCKKQKLVIEWVQLNPLIDTHSYAGEEKTLESSATEQFFD